jgi:UMF1 family MFS transporter
MQSLLARVGLERPEVRAWAMYDWANSAFQSTIITAVFPPFFTAYVAYGVLDEDTAAARFMWTTTIALTIAAVIGPVLGALADYRAWKKRLLAGCVAVGVVATLLFATIDRGEWMYAALLFLIANIAVATSLVFYDSLLPHIVRKDEIDRVSTAGYAIGFIGGGILLLVNLAWILRPDAFGIADRDAAVKLSFISVAVWWLLFSIPVLRRVPEPPRVLEPDEQAQTNPLRAAFTRLRETFHEIRGYRNAFLMLIAFLLYNDGIGTIIKMSAVYAELLDISQNVQIQAFVMVQFVGVPCSFLFGTLAGRVGAKRALFGGLAVYTVISLLAYFMTAAWQFFLLAFLVALVQGGTQALSRSLFARMIPRHKSSEFFGFFSVFEKFAGIAGPAIFAASLDLFGNPRLAVLSIVAFFIAGAFMLTKVNVAQGEAEAAAATHAL